MTGLTIPKEQDHATGRTKKTRELSDPQPSSPFPAQGSCSSQNSSPDVGPQEYRTERQHESIASGPAQPQFIHLSTLHPQGVAKRLKAGAPGLGFPGSPFPDTKSPPPLTSVPRGFSMRPNSFFNRHRVQEAILASPLSPSALIGRLPEPRANHASGNRNSRCRPRLRPSSP